MRRNSQFFGIITLFVGTISVFAGAASAQDKLPDSDPKMTNSVTYSLPEKAVDAEIDGKVRVAIDIDKTGVPTRAVVISGPMWPCSRVPTDALDELYKTLSATMMKLQFSPAIKDGKPVAKNMMIALTLKNPKVVPEPGVKDPVTGRPKPALIEAGVLNGRATSLSRPGYPAAAKPIRAGGAVSIHVLLDETGKVIRAGAIDGHPLLQFAAREAACESKFHPTLLSGTPIKVSGSITYNFVP